MRGNSIQMDVTSLVIKEIFFNCNNYIKFKPEISDILKDMIHSKKSITIRKRKFTIGILDKLSVDDFSQIRVILDDDDYEYSFLESRIMSRYDLEIPTDIEVLIRMVS